MSREKAIEAGARALDPDAWDLLRLTRMAFGETLEETTDRLRAEARERAAAVIDAATPHLVGDEYHSLAELYLYRMLYNAHAANEWARHGTYPVVKSRFHSDGLMCFGGGWFIVVATLPAGQVSNHYQNEFWDLFQVPEVALPPEYDGHSPADAGDRLYDALIPVDEP